MSLIGSRIGRFRVESLLGAGGMGYVYKGHDEILGRHVALKAAGAKNRMTPLEKTRFLREARTLSHLDHPNICRIYDLVEHRDSDYLVLEYIEGATLKKKMRAGLTHERKLEIAETVARVLCAAHGEDIIHRDLKPENVMIRPDGEIKVLDFGLARSLQEDEEERVNLISALKNDWAEVEGEDSEDESLPPLPADSYHTSFGSIVGTFRYMSPEQARSEDATTASDLYTMGVLLFEMFCDRSAYEDGLSMPSLLYRVGRAEALDPFEACPQLDQDLARLIKELLQLDPAARPTARETHRRLRAIRKKPARLRRKRFRNWVLASLVLLTAVSFILMRRWFTDPDLIQPGEIGKIILLPFQNQSGDPNLDWVEWGLRGMVAEALGEMEGLSIISEDSLRVFVIDQEHSLGRPLPDTSLALFRETLKANLLVRSVVERKGDRFQVRFTIYNFAGAKTTDALWDENLTRLAPELGERIAYLVRPDIPAGSYATKLSPHDLANQNYAMGRQRLISHGPRVARDYFEVGVDLDPGFHSANIMLADCLLQLGHFEESREIAQRILEKKETREDYGLQQRCLRILTLIATNFGDLETADRLTREARELAEAGNRIFEEGNILLASGNIANRQKKPGMAETYYARALKIFREQGNLYNEVSALNNLGVIAHERGEYDRAASLYNNALDLSRQVHHPRLEAECLVNLAVLAMDQEEFGDAERYNLSALALWEALAIPVQIALAKNNLALLAAFREDLEGAERLWKQALEINLQLGNAEGICLNSNNLSELYLLYMETPEAAAPFIDRALECFEDEPDTLWLGALYYSFRKQFDKALALGEMARALAGAGWDPERRQQLDIIFQSVQDRQSQTIETQK